MLNRSKEVRRCSCSCSQQESYVSLEVVNGELLFRFRLLCVQSLLYELGDDDLLSTDPSSTDFEVREFRFVRLKVNNNRLHKFKLSVTYTTFKVRLLYSIIQIHNFYIVLVTERLYIILYTDIYSHLNGKFCKFFNFK